MNQKSLFCKQKRFLLRITFLTALKICLFPKQKAFLFPNSSLSPSKAPLFHLKHCKFAPSHNLLSTKEHGCSFNLRSKSLRCNARASHRFKAFSPPFCAKNRVRLVPPENSAEIYFDRALNRRSQDGVPRAFWLLFARRKKWQSALPCRERFEVLQTSNQHTKTTTSHKPN